MRTIGDDGNPVRLKTALYDLASDYNQKLIKMIADEGFEKSADKIALLMHIVDDLNNLIIICKERNRF